MAQDVANTAAATSLADEARMKTQGLGGETPGTKEPAQDAQPARIMSPEPQSPPLPVAAQSADEYSALTQQGPRIDPTALAGIESAQTEPEIRSASPVEQTTPSSQMRATQIVQQLAPVMKVFPDGIAEVTLAPQELGHVRMAMRLEGDGIVVHLTADRPETLDLMQRHTWQLGNALRDAGFADVNFTFSQDGRQPPSDTSGRDPGGIAAAEHNDIPPLSQPNGLEDSDRLDLRL